MFDSISNENIPQENPFEGEEFEQANTILEREFKYYLDLTNELIQESDEYPAGLADIRISKRTEEESDSFVKVLEETFEPRSTLETKMRNYVQKKLDTLADIQGSKERRVLKGWLIYDYIRKMKESQLKQSSSYTGEINYPTPTKPLERVVEMYKKLNSNNSIS